MKFRADRQFIEKIDEPICGELSIRAQLQEFLSEDLELFTQMLDSELDEEFEFYGAKTIDYSESADIELDENVAPLIEYVISQKAMTEDQALTLILDVIEVYLINGHRMCS